MSYQDQPASYFWVQNLVAFGVILLFGGACHFLGQLIGFQVPQLVVIFGAAIIYGVTGYIFMNLEDAENSRLRAMQRKRKSEQVLDNSHDDWLIESTGEDKSANGS